MVRQFDNVFILIISNTRNNESNIIHCIKNNTFFFKLSFNLKYRIYAILSCIFVIKVLRSDDGYTRATYK